MDALLYNMDQLFANVDTLLYNMDLHRATPIIDHEKIEIIELKKCYIKSYKELIFLIS